MTGFDDPARQREAGVLGMWVFLVTEVMFFGGLFAAYTVYRWIYAPGFAAASGRLDLAAGAVNTAVLITSSFTMALAVHAARRGRRRRLALYLILTLVLGLAFLAVKGVEYSHKAAEGLVPGRGFHLAGKGTEVFFSLYFVMTGTHALHMMVGAGVLSALVALSWRGRFSPGYFTPVELAGLYWHFVDVVWIFLFPLLYLVGGHA